MSTPDPKTVREIARDALVVAVRRGATEAVEVALIAHGGGGPVVGEKFDVYTNAVAAEYDRMAAALARPDEQQPADVVTTEQQQDGAAGPDLTYRVTQAYRAARFMRLDDDALIQGIVAAVLAERTALAEQVAELAGERDEARAQLRTETAITKALLADKEELAMRAHHAEVNRDQARAALESARVPAEQAAGDGEAEREAVERLTAMLAQLDKYAADHQICRCGRAQTVLGEILSVSVDCEVGHGDPIGAGNATGEDLRTVLDRLRRLEQERAATVAYLKPPQVADVLGVTVRTLLRWRKAGEGPAFVQEGHVVRYRTDVIEAWSKSARHVQATEAHQRALRGVSRIALAERDGREASAPGRVRTEPDGASE